MRLSKRSDNVYTGLYPKIQSQRNVNCSIIKSKYNPLLTLGIIYRITWNVFKNIRFRLPNLQSTVQIRHVSFPHVHYLTQITAYIITITLLISRRPELRPLLSNSGSYYVKPDVVLFDLFYYVVVCITDHQSLGRNSVTIYPRFYMIFTSNN